MTDVTVLSPIFGLAWSLLQLLVIINYNKRGNLGMHKSIKLAATAPIIVLAAAFSAGQASAALCPAIGANTNPGCGEQITFNANGSITTSIVVQPGSTATTAAPYDGIEDTSVGVINNSGHAISSIFLSSTQTIASFSLPATLHNQGRSPNTRRPPSWSPGSPSSWQRRNVAR